MSTFLDAKTALGVKGYVIDASAEEALRAGYRRVLSERRWPFLASSGTLSTVAGQRSYDLSGLSEFGEIDAVTLDNRGNASRLVYVAPAQERVFNADDPVADFPQLWTLYGLATLRLWPVPDQTYTLNVDYVRDAADPATDASVLLIPHRFIDTMVWAAIEELSYRQRDGGAVQQATMQYERQLSTMIRAFGVRQRAGSTQVGSSDFWEQTAL